MNLSLPICLSAALLMMVSLESCKGPEGPAGPVGPAGAVGPVGSKGDPGNANVVYSDWKTVNWSVSGGSNGAYYLSSPATTNALFTKDAINTAAIFTYIKYATYVETSVPQKYQLVERITSDLYINHYFKIPGRTDTRIFDYGYANVNRGDIGENYFAPYLFLNTSTLGTEIQELKNQPPDVIKGLVSNLPQFRHVIVYGNVKGGRLAAVNWSDYNEVKQVLGLKE